MFKTIVLNVAKLPTKTIDFVSHLINNRHGSGVPILPQDYMLPSIAIQRKMTYKFHDEWNSESALSLIVDNFDIFVDFAFQTQLIIRAICYFKTTFNTFS